MTGAPWADRWGFVFGKFKPKFGNVERYLTYSKLHRTGNLMRRMAVGRKTTQAGAQIILFNTADYAEEHNEGSVGGGAATIRPPYVQGGAKGVKVGGDITRRHFMDFRPSTMRLAYVLLGRKMKSFGW